jgi:hypothetical protein
MAILIQAATPTAINSQTDTRSARFELTFLVTETLQVVIPRKLYRAEG